ncbi:hypothetical protein, partial [Exiguobacterium sp. s150]|uniref:hypothetical protein n=1 Tax=Exiguobacterium sp. s150 TaxID=2751221 RepID=UPI001BEA42BF
MKKLALRASFLRIEYMSKRPCRFFNGSSRFRDVCLTLPQLKQWDSEVLVRAQSISVLLKPSDE